MKTSGFIYILISIFILCPLFLYGAYFTFWRSCGQPGVNPLDTPGYSTSDISIMEYIGDGNHATWDLENQTLEFCGPIGNINYMNAPFTNESVVINRVEAAIGLWNDVFTDGEFDYTIIIDEDYNLNVENKFRINFESNYVRWYETCIPANYNDGGLTPIL